MTSVVGFSRDMPHGLNKLKNITFISCYKDMYIYF
jgi:hypothetical protein